MGGSTASGRHTPRPGAARVSATRWVLWVWMTHCASGAAP